MIKNRGRYAPAFQGGVSVGETRPAPHPIEKTTNGLLPGSGTPRASTQSDPGPLVQSCVPKAGVLVRPSQTSDDNDRKALVSTSSHPKNKIQSIGLIDVRQPLL